MSHRWDQTINITPEIATTLLSSQFNVTVDEISVLGEGFDNIAFLVNHSLVFRFPRRELGVMCIENEMMLLPYLADKLSFPFSHPTFIGAPSDLYPFPFAGYPLLSGVPLSQAASHPISEISFAKQLGQWLNELHALPVLKEHVDMIKGDQTWRLNLKQRKEVLLNNIKQYEQIYVEADFSSDILINTFHHFHEKQFLHDKECYLHGDLYAKHVLVDKAGSLNGLIDWGDTHIGHPAIDLSVGIMIFSDNALEHFFSSYGNINDNMIQTAVFRAFCHGFAALPYFTLIQDVKGAAWTRAALQKALQMAK